MPKRSKDPLKLKRLSFFLFSLAVFFLPSQNFFLVSQKPTDIFDLNSNLSLADYPENITGLPVPKTKARSYLILDPQSMVPLAAKNEKVVFPPGSTVKIMTALVALEQFKLEEILEVKRVDSFGQDIGLLKGEKLTVESLLKALLISSANDAAMAIAQNYPGGEEAFVGRMNQKAADLRLEKTYFANPTGLDVNADEKLLTSFSYTTAFDLARLAINAMRNDFIAQTVSTKMMTIDDTSGKISHQLTNINELLGRLPGTKGVKTGFTNEAGQCLVALIERDGRRIVTVILGSDDRFGETEKLVNWAYANHQWGSLTPPSRDPRR